MNLVSRALLVSAARCCRRLLLLLLLAAVLAAQTGCATSDADLDYTRQTTPDPTQDHSYHGWNNANN